MHRAIDIYLELAYPAGPPPAIKAMCEKLRTWPGDFYENPLFVKSAGPERLSYSLRLGNRHYPHMKLLIEAWSEGSRHFFRVDSHDKHIGLSMDHPEYKAFHQLCQKNQALTESIEAAWRDAGVPTFTSCLADDLAQRELRG